MNKRNKPTTPAATLYCPLCGGANQCAPANSGSFAVDCWCKTTAISATALARAKQQRESQPPKELGARNTAQLATSSDSRGDACLCPHCAVQP